MVCNTVSLVKTLVIIAVLLFLQQGMQGFSQKSQ